MNLRVLGAHIHVIVGVREWMWLNVRESACESVCELFECANLPVNMCAWVHIYM